MAESWAIAEQRRDQDETRAALIQDVVDQRAEEAWGNGDAEGMLQDTVLNDREIELLVSVRKCLPGKPQTFLERHAAALIGCFEERVKEYINEHEDMEP